MKQFLILMFFMSACSNGSKAQLFARGGTHILDNRTCKLIRSKPVGAVKDLGWKDQLALEGNEVSTAEIICDGKRRQIEFVDAVRIELFSDARTLVVGDKVSVNANFFDVKGRKVDIGKLTSLDWSAEGLDINNDNSSGEFGFCSTCFGQQTFRCKRPGIGSIKVVFRGIEKEIHLEIGSKNDK